MRVVETEIPGVLVIVPDVLTDGRGFFVETYHAERYRQCGIDGPFVQDNHTRSVSGTIRGLHLQRRRMQGKLIRVIEGEVHVQPNAERFVARVLAVNGRCHRRLANNINRINKNRYSAGAARAPVSTS